MNINDSSQIRQCTSCQMCGAVCPTGAIIIQLNDDGFYRPVINDDACIDCGLCVKSCYKFDNAIEQSDLSSKKIIAAWAKDIDIINATTSGGIADLLARQLIKEGYKCIGVAYDTNTNCAVGKIATTESEILMFRGSKYIQSLSVDSFKALVKDYKKEKFAVFGLPCQIYAIDKFLKSCRARDNHILVDLYCHGCPSLHVWTKYVDEIMHRVNGNKVISANFRSKVRGWGNFYIVVVVDGVNNPIEVVSPRINDGFYELFFSDLVLNDSCSDCKLRSTLEYTDIRLGDFWGKSYVNNHRGVSGITFSTERGEDLVNSISNQMNVQTQNFGNFLPYQSYGKIYIVNSDNRKKLLTLLSNDTTTLEECVSFYHHMLPAKSKIKHLVKNIVKLMPKGLVSLIKSFVYSIK